MRRGKRIKIVEASIASRLEEDAGFAAGSQKQISSALYFPKVVGKNGARSASYACSIDSPSQSGIKTLTLIPPVVDRHRGRRLL